MDELERLMARFDPAPHEVRPDELLLADILITARPCRRPGRSWRLTAGVALATGLVIVAANAMPAEQAQGQVAVAAYFRYPGADLALCGEPGPRPRILPKSGGEARAVLLALAGAAEAAGPPPARAAGFSQVTVASSRLVTDDTGSEVRSTVSEQWTPVSGKGERQRVEYPLSGHGHHLVQDERGREAAPYVPGLVLGTLPAEPGALRARLLERMRIAGRPETYRLVNAIVELYENEVVDGPHAAAIWRVLAERPDVRALGQVTDRRERPGQGLAFDVGGRERWVLVVDERTGELLSVERVLLAGTAGLAVTPPCVRDFWAFIARKWVPAVN